MDATSTDRASASSTCFCTTIARRWRRRESRAVVYPPIPETSLERRQQSLFETDSAQPVSTLKEPETYLYLAYGSNLSNETFLGKRGIKPVSAINVQVPELRLTFDLPGIPYSEPCFANSGRRDPHHPSVNQCSEDFESEKTPLLQKGLHTSKEYRKNQWKKGMVGVVYEVTASDYAHIIATEGGGSSYHDILIDCHPIASSDPSVPVPVVPDTKAFKAHTLFAPAVPEGEQPPKDGGRFQRPDTSYAQASARYLKLLTDGAEERRLPYEYQDYLRSLQPYTITSQKQRLGLFVFMTLWMPFIFFVFALQKAFSDDSGRAPEWLRLLAAAVFKAVWGSYDNYFKDLFGDGERTQKGQEDEEAPPENACSEGARSSSWQPTMSYSDAEKAHR